MHVALSDQLSQVSLPPLQPGDFLAQLDTDLPPSRQGG